MAKDGRMWKFVPESQLRWGWGACTLRGRPRGPSLSPVGLDMSSGLGESQWVCPPRTEPAAEAARAAGRNKVGGRALAAGG